MGVDKSCSGTMQRRILAVATETCDATRPGRVAGPSSPARQRDTTTTKHDSTPTVNASSANVLSNICRCACHAARPADKLQSAHAVSTRSKTSHEPREAAVITEKDECQLSRTMTARSGRSAHFEKAELTDNRDRVEIRATMQRLRSAVTNR